jgi:enoyl-CoA hydratase
MSDWQKRYQRLLFDRPHPKVLRVTMNRPDKYNATDSIMHTELVNVWRDIDGDDTVNCVIIQGAGGKVFSAGGDFDLIEKNMKDFNALLRTWKEARDIVYNVINCSKPIVSTMRGPAVGAGLVAGILADVSIASKKAKIIDGHTRLGVAAGDHAVIVWPLLCGMAKAKYYLLLCEAVDGEEAERIGLVSMCVEDDQLEAKGLEVATKLAEGAQTSIRFTKYALNNWLRMMGPSFDASTALEMLGFMGPEVKEGLASHLEKRKPKFDPYSPI